MTQIGLMIEGQWGLTWERWAGILKTAEEAGYQCVFRSDHYTIGPPDQDSLETWISLTYAADHTERIEFGPLVSPTTFRHPALTARMAAQVDDLSEGRLVFGMGTGWHEREHKQFGIYFPDIPTRYEMFEDALEITTKLFESDEHVSYAGKHFSLDEAIMLPRPQRRTPILIGGNGPKKTLPLVARFADEWNGVYLTPQVYKERNELLTEYLEKEGRQPGDVKRSMMTEVIYGEDAAALERRKAATDKPADELLERNIIVGQGQEVVDRIGDYVDVGLERIMLMWRLQDDLDGIVNMANDVLPHFHKG